MTIQTTGPNGILYKLVERALIEAHRNDIVKFNIVNTEKLKQEFRDALKKDYDIKDIDESDILFCFEEVDQNEVEQKDDNPKEDGGEVQDKGSDEEQNNDENEVSDDPEIDDTEDDSQEQTDDKESSENDEESGNDSEPSFGITGGDSDDKEKDNTEDTEDDSHEDDSEEDGDEDETVKAVKEAIMKEEEEEEKTQGDGEESDQYQDEQGDEIENATEKDKEDSQGTTIGSSKTKENVVKAVARALYIDNPDDIQMFDINYQNKRCFFIKANIRK